MQSHIEAWARYCATHKYSVRMTLEYAMAHNRAVLSVTTWGPTCEICGGLLQVGYKVQLPTDTPRVFTIGYIHTHPEWCERATEARRVKDECVRLLEASKKQAIRALQLAGCYSLDVAEVVLETAGEAVD